MSQNSELRTQNPELKTQRPMRTLFYLLQKEFLQIFRNKTMLPLIFVLPVVQLIVLVNAATLDMKNIRVTVVDNDISSLSRSLIQSLDASPFFEVEDMAPDAAQAYERLKKNQTDVVLVVPPECERKLESDL